MNSLIARVAQVFQTFRSHRLRAFLTTLGIIIGVTTVIAILSLIEGLNRSVAKQIQNLGSDLIYLQKFTWVQTGQQDYEKLAQRSDLLPEDAEAISKLPSVEIAIPDISSRVSKLKYKDHEISNVSITGSDENYSWVNNHIVESGRDFSSDDILHRRKLGIIGSYLSAHIFPDESPIGKDIYIRDSRFKIIGVFKEKGQFLGKSLDNYILISYTVFEKVFPKNRESVFARIYGGYSIDIKSKTINIDRTIDDVRELMRWRHGLSFDQEDDFELNTQQVLMDLYKNITNVGFIAIV